jgi:hypothetical protein
MNVARVEEIGSDGAVRMLHDAAKECASPVDGADYASGRVWPDPLAAEAFHGITGEIVRAIEPHTEADSSALLFQFLGGAGNMIGRGPYTMADGGRHGCNLFAAIVGVSSKGRKGTAWNHIRRVLEAIDLEWTGRRL